MTTRVAKVKKTSLTEQVVTNLRTSIVSGALPPGTHLAEAQLTKQLGVSRGSLREAFVQLEAQGLVESYPGRGSFVTELFEDDISEIYALRLVLEKEAVRLFTHRASPAEVATLKNLSEDMVTADLVKDTATIVQLNLEYHNLVWKAAGNQRLYDLLRTLYGQVQLYLASAMQLQSQEKRSQTLQEHRDLVAAVAAAETDKAVAIMQVHLEEAERLVKLFLLQSGQHVS